MLRGVLAALGGIGLAAAVVVGWVMYTRNAPSPAPAAAPAAAIEGVEAIASDADPVEPDTLAAEPGDPGEVVPQDGAGVAPEGEAKPADATTSAPDASHAIAEPDRAGEPPIVDPKTKKRRTGKTRTDDSKQPDASQPEPEPPEPEPEPEGSTGKKRKPGDLRDPF
jgi:hypothetical protein